MNMGRPVELSELIYMLSGRAREICKDLFPEGNFSHGNMSIGSLAGEPGKSLSVRLTQSPGTWRDFSTGEHGDILELIAQARYGGDKRLAIQWARNFLGLGDLKPDELQERRRQLDLDMKRAKKARQKEEARRRHYAWHIWGIEATKDIIGTPVEDYLKSRAIDINQLPSTGAIRFHDNLLYRCKGDPRDGERFPAMVCAIVGGDGKFMACHRTYLEPDGRGGFKKADVETPKTVLASATGGHISLNKGSEGVSLRRAKENKEVVMSEGVENGLTCVLATPDRRVISCYSLANLATVIIPKHVNVRIFVPDMDEAEQAKKMFKRALIAHRSQGACVLVVQLDGAKDINADLMGAAS